MSIWLLGAIHFLHLAGAALAIGGLATMAFAVLPATRELDGEQQAFRARLRGGARRVTWIAIGLLVVSGLLKWAPFTGGVGWLGHGGLHTGLLHGKLVLALVTFHLALSLSRAPRPDARPTTTPGRARLAFALAMLLVLLAVLHRYRVFA